MTTKAQSTTEALPPEDMTDDELKAAISFHERQAFKFKSEGAKMWRLRLRIGNGEPVDRKMLAELHERRASRVDPAAPVVDDNLVSDVDRWKRDLIAAGWAAKSATAWQAPDGGLWRGPFGAWKELQRREKASGTDTNWPLCDVLTQLVEWAKHLHDDHDCDCHGWEARSFLIEAANRYAATAAPQQSDARPSCWHCGVVLAYAPKLRCEDCPDECDVEGCDELGCAPATPTAAPSTKTIEAFRDLKLGWDSYGGREINTEAIEIALRLAPLLPDWQPVPRSDGGIQFERGDDEICIDVGAAAPVEQSGEDFERAYFCAVRALRHLKNKNHKFIPLGCDGCKEVALFLTEPGYRGDEHNPVGADFERSY